jgi:hypothetical protein|tara:strand:+ start:34 stop:381 length:348 start_codon:yes stop_codon:yes gene_type:complete
MSNSVEYEIAMNEASRREALEAFAILKRNKTTNDTSLLFSTETLFTNESIELLTKQNDKNKKIIYELKCEKNKLEYKLIEINDNISTLLDGECYTGNIPSSVIAYFREIQDIISK